MNVIEKVTEQYNSMLNSEEVKRIKAGEKEIDFRVGNLSYEEEVERAIEYTRNKYVNILKQLENC